MPCRFPLSGAVLAGGKSRRMGTDKRWVPVAGVPMVVRAIDALRPVADEVFVVGEAGHRGTPVPVFADLRRDHGPVAGIETALVTARHEFVIVVAVDHPWLSSAVLALLVDRLVAEPDRLSVILGTTSGPQPLIGAWRASARPALGHLLDSGERRAMSLIDHLPVDILAVADWVALDPEGKTATDLDTPEELHRASESSDDPPHERRPR
ncbi:MAG: molybdenum cofactor guanylyltransferase [Nitriliruptoraceae bacterium]